MAKPSACSLPGLPVAKSSLSAATGLAPDASEENVQALAASKAANSTQHHSADGGAFEAFLLQRWMPSRLPRRLTSCPGQPSWGHAPPLSTPLCRLPRSPGVAVPHSRRQRQRQGCRSSAVDLAATEYRTGVQHNANISKLQAGYLFPKIARRRNAHLEKNPGAPIISLGIGDTTEPIPTVITDAMAKRAQGLSTRSGYSGYGAEQGEKAVRAALCNAFYSGLGIQENEVFVSGGAKCDIARLQMMFGANVTMACQDPSYPAYVDTSVMMGQTGTFTPSTQQYSNVAYLKCTPENNFFPDLASAPRTDIIFFCSPNNPTGSAATRAQLQELVDFARRNGSIIVYDCAYALYISNPDCPKSIFEIPGADEVAIETGSFSKYAGFTGVRLGWTVVPSALKYADGSAVITDFNRVMTTCFNGASNVAQSGGLACLSPEGLEAMNGLVKFYKENAAILGDTFRSLGLDTYGGINAPYVWVRFPGRASWDVFSEILEKANIVTTPGSGFGPGGEGFVRASAFGSRENILEASRRLKKVLAKA